MPNITATPYEVYIFSRNGPTYFYDLLGLVACGCGPDITAWLEWEMYGNARSQLVADMASDNAKFDLWFTLGSSPWTSPLQFLALWHKGRAYVNWSAQVAPKKPWDHKPLMNSVFDLRCGAQDRCLDFLTMTGLSTKKCYRTDVPSNIHYGYVGNIAGFRRLELLGGASWAQLAWNIFHGPGGGFDPPEDQDAIKTGWDAVGSGLEAALDTHSSELAGTSECKPCGYSWTQYLGH